MGEPFHVPANAFIGLRQRTLLGRFRVRVWQRKKTMMPARNRQAVYNPHVPESLRRDWAGECAGNRGGMRRPPCQNRVTPLRLQLYLAAPRPLHPPASFASSQNARIPGNNAPSNEFPWIPYALVRIFRTRVTNLWQDLNLRISPAPTFFQCGRKYFDLTRGRCAPELVHWGRSPGGFLCQLKMFRSAVGPASRAAGHTRARFAECGLHWQHPADKVVSAAPLYRVPAASGQS